MERKDLSMKKCIVLGYVLVLLSTSLVWSQVIYPPTLKVPVTYYDFHSNGSNPEFEKAPTGAPTRLGMVAATLGPNRKPALGPTPYWDCDIAKWFVAWTPGDFTIPNYTNPVTTTCSNPVSTVNYDTAFKNMVFQDTLTFTLVPGSAGTYQYNNANFFPLDGRGFLAEVSQGTMRTHNYSFTMELHWVFQNRPGLTFQFAGDDDVWAFINNRLVMDIGGIHNTTQGSVNVDTLGLVNRKDTLDFFYAERHVTGSDIQITTNIISTQPIGINLSRVPATNIINTGDSIVYAASVIDDTLGVRKDLSRLITWSVAPLVPGSIRPNFTPAARMLRSTAGDSNTFYGGQAYRYYVITSVLVDPSNPSNILRKYDTVYVKPGPDYRVVIEADTIIDTFAPARLGLITMSGSTNSARAYALVRDIYGQYTRMANNAEWTSRDPALATVAAGPPKYVGIISRIPLQNGTDTIVANETTPNLLLPDSVQLVLQSGTVDSIRLVNSVTGGVITSISMNTDSSLSVKIQVVWSNDVNHAWVDGTGTWALTPDTIQWDANPPTEGGSWNISPRTPGNENLAIASGAVSKTVPLIITPAPPSRATIELANPTDSIIAGRPFKVLVKVYNTDGLMPGTWCSNSATYTDVLGNGTKTAIPIIVFNGVPAPVPLGQPSGECFHNGLDTITVTLYNAPVSLDSVHIISLLLNNNTITLPIASTSPFHLYPGPLATLKLEYSNGKDMPGPDTLYYPDGAVNIFARGYDQWGNLIGSMRSTWTQNGTLHNLTPPTTNQINIYYDASNSIFNEAGWISASAPSGTTPGTAASDSVQVIIVPRGANLSEAITKDMNGNGILDQILVKLDKPVPVSTGAGSIIVKDVEHNVVFSVDSLRPLNSTGDSTSTFIIYLHDIDSTQNGILEPAGALPQTSWRPLLSISGLKGANDFSGQKCKDGAGPVVWKVVLTKNSTTDRSKDLVTVTFSEPIQASNGNDFSINNLPSAVFSTWKKDGNSLVLDPSILACNPTVSGSPCIGVFYKIVDLSTVQFYMLNQRTLFDYDYFSIQIPSQVADKANPANLPDTINQRVKVVITGVVSPMLVGPNPASPTYFNVPSAGSVSEIVFKNDQNATRYAKQNGGTVFRFEISPGDSDRVTGYLNIYDVVGNVVNSVHRDGPTDNLLTDIKNTIGTGSGKDTLGYYNYDIYWNGVNAKGMKVSPGVYHAFMYLTSYGTNGSIKKSRQQGIVGIAR